MSTTNNHSLDRVESDHVIPIPSPVTSISGHEDEMVISEVSSLEGEPVHMVHGAIDRPPTPLPHGMYNMYSSPPPSIVGRNQSGAIRWDLPDEVLIGRRSRARRSNETDWGYLQWLGNRPPTPYPMGDEFARPYWNPGHGASIRTQPPRRGYRIDPGEVGMSQIRIARDGQSPSAWDDADSTDHGGSQHNAESRSIDEPMSKSMLVAFIATLFLFLGSIVVLAGFIGLLTLEAETGQYSSPVSFIWCGISAIIAVCSGIELLSQCFKRSIVSKIFSPSPSKLCAIRRRTSRPVRPAGPKEFELEDMVSRPPAAAGRDLEQQGVVFRSGEMHRVADRPPRLPLELVDDFPHPPPRAVQRDRGPYEIDSDYPDSARHTYHWTPNVASRLAASQFETVATHGVGGHMQASSVFPC